MRPITVQVGPSVAGGINSVTNGVSGAGTSLPINGTAAVAGTAYFTAPTKIVIYSTTGDNSGTNFTIFGTALGGALHQETIQGPTSGFNVQTRTTFVTVTRITIDTGGIVGTITVGNLASSFESPWVFFDSYAPPQISIQTVAYGTVNYTVQQTLDDPNSATTPVDPLAVTWINHPDSNLVNATGNVQSNYGYAPTYAKVIINSGTGYVVATFTQAGNVTK